MVAIMPPAPPPRLQPEILQLAAEHVIPGDSVEVAIKSEDAERPRPGPERDGRVALLQPVEGVARDAHALGEQGRRDSPAEAREPDAIAQLTDLLFRSREERSKGPAHV